MKIISKDKTLNTAILTVIILTVSTSLIYLKTNYQSLDDRVESIKIILDKPVQSKNFVVYISDSTDAAINFYESYFSESKYDSVLLFPLKAKVRLRQFRLYIHQSIENITVKGIYLESNKTAFKLDLSELASNSIQVSKKNNDYIIFKVTAGNDQSYFESRMFYYSSDHGLLAGAILIIIIITVFVFLLLLKTLGPLLNWNSIPRLELSVVAFIFSIFLPQALSNITLVISILLLAKNFKIQNIYTNRLSLLFLLLYAIIIFNFLIFTPDYNFSTIEKYTPFLILPFYVSCIQSNQLHIFFCISAFLIGIGLFARALINISILRNPEIISFSNFTGTIHPVYFSYLLAFSIIFIELSIKSNYKYLLYSILGLLLIFSGSKLIVIGLLIALLLMQKKVVNLLALSIVIASLFLFTPFRERLASIIGFNDLSIVSEKHIENGDDSRLNGVTLRVIIWQECLDLNLREFMFGKGIGTAGDRALESRLSQRGLTSHLVYNAHNQYITTLFKTGVIGLSVLLAIIFACFYSGLMTKNFILIFFTIVMSIAMISESIFERSFGTTFFCLMLLLLLKIPNDVKIEPPPKLNS